MFCVLRFVVLFYVCVNVGCWMLDPRNAFGCPLLCAVSVVRAVVRACLTRSISRARMDLVYGEETSQRFISSSGKRQDKT